MRNVEKEQLPLLNIERSPLFLGATVVLSVLIVFLGYRLLEAMNPWGFVVMVPAAILSFQTAWWLLNPFAEVYDNRVEIKQSLFHDKIRYFVDITKTELRPKGILLLTYNDEEVEALNLFGIKVSQLETIQSEIAKFVKESLKSRS